MNARLRQNSVNDVKIQKVKFLLVYLASLNFSFVNMTRLNCNKNSLCLAKYFTLTNRIYTGMPVVPVPNSMSGSLKDSWTYIIPEGGIRGLRWLEESSHWEAHRKIL